MKLPRKGFFATLVAGPGVAKAVAKPKAEPVDDYFSYLQRDDGYTKVFGCIVREDIGWVNAKSRFPAWEFDYLLQKGALVIGEPLIGVIVDESLAAEERGDMDGGRTHFLYGNQAQRFLEWWRG